MQERHKNADLEHVHELLIESLIRHLAIVHRLIIKDLDLVLLD